MWLILFRVFVVVLLAQAGYFYSPFPGQPWAGAGLGLLVAARRHRLRGKGPVASPPTTWWARSWAA